MSAPRVSIILLNFNNAHDTLDCLRSLEHVTYPNVDTIVVDNHSSDDSVSRIRAAFPNITLIESEANLGFTGGNNLGLRHALATDASYIMLLNNDTIVAPDMFDIMVDVMEKDPTIGVSGPMIYFYDAPDTIWSIAGRIDWKTGTTSMVGLYEQDNGQYGTGSHEADFITGCALLVRREVWEKAGLLDDNFFIYYEETEWCVRASRAGFRIVYIPDAMMWHKIPLEARASSSWAYYYMTRNRLLFLRKTQVGLRTWLNVGIEYVRTFASWTLRPKWRDRRHLRSLMFRAIKDFYAGNYGQTLRKA